MSGQERVHETDRPDMGVTSCAQLLNRWCVRERAILVGHGQLCPALLCSALLCPALTIT